MPFRELSVMSQKREFVRLALAEGANRRELCRRFGVSPTLGYKLIRRYAAAGDAGLAEQSRRPRHSPSRTPFELEAAVLAIRAEHPCWGGRKIAARLKALGHDRVPAPSTITAILSRHDQLGPGTSLGRAVRPARTRSPASSTTPPTGSGRWTSRAISRWAVSAAIR